MEASKDHSFFLLGPIKVDGATTTVKNGVVKIILPKAKNVKCGIQAHSTRGLSFSECLYFYLFLAHSVPSKTPHRS